MTQQPETNAQHVANLVMPMTMPGRRGGMVEG